MLEFGREIALEIVFDDEDAEEIGIAAGTEDVPGQGGQAERRDCGGMKQPEGVAPALGENGPEEDGAAGQDDGGGAFCENREAEKKSEEQQSEPRRVREGLACASFWDKAENQAAHTIAMVSIPLKGMSVAAACEKPIMPTVVGKSSSSQRAVSSP